jgi:ABC-type antimicrobial peptide transport system permease subunit
VARLVTPVMSAFLFGVHPIDPVTYAAVSATLGVVALIGIYLPARRATRVDPLLALRAE